MSQAHVLSDPEGTTVTEATVYRVDAITAPILQMGKLRLKGITGGRQNQEMAATRMQELMEVDLLTMKLLFGERRVGEETGVPSTLYSQPQLL